MVSLPTTTAITLLANVTSTIADPGLLAVIGVAIGVPFAFYVIKNVIALIPKR